MLISLTNKYSCLFPFLLTWSGRTSPCHRPSEELLGLSWPQAPAPSPNATRPLSCTKCLHKHLLCAT